MLGVRPFTGEEWAGFTAKYTISLKYELGTPSVGKMFVIISVAALGTLSKPHLYMSITEAFIEGLMYLTEPGLSNSLIPGRDNEISRSLEAFLFSSP